MSSVYKQARRELWRYARQLKAQYYTEHEARVLFRNRAEWYMPDRAYHFETRVFDAVWSEPTTHFNLTMLGNSERFVAQYGDDVRFCHEKKAWLIWDGKRWVEDRAGRINELAKETVRSIVREAERVENEELRDGLISHSRRSETSAQISGTATLAQTNPDLALSPDQLDSDPWLLNCENGTIDLRTGKLLPHSREHLITKIIPIHYDPRAKCRMWDAFIYKVMGGNWDLIEFLQRAVGYSLTGDTRERCLFFAVGPTASGKTTFIEAVRALLDDYAKATDFDSFVHGKRTNIRNDLARLEKARFVSAVEARRGDKFDEGLVKHVTGRDTFMARFLYHEFFEFRPEFKIFLAANHRPRIEDVDEAIWARFHVIPFRVQIPQDEQDKDLGERLKRELAGILAWAVRGCLEWQRLQGLQPPESIREALRVYKAESDPLNVFLNERCLLLPKYEETTANLYADCKDWCADNEEEVVSVKRFGMLLRERGLVPVRTLISDEGKQARDYRGILLESRMARDLLEEMEHSYETRNLYVA